MGCFSLITHKRSFDFICRTDEHVECYVLSLSRLCQKASGGSNFPVEGAIDSHTEFVATRGWCKVEHTCKNKNLDLATAVKLAIRRANHRAVMSPRSLRDPKGAERSRRA